MKAVPAGSWRGWAERLARIGLLPSDSPEEALRKETLVLFTSLTALLSCIWVGTYSALGLYVSAAIPFAYQVASVANLVFLAKTKKYRVSRGLALTLSLLLPFFLQLSLGGFLPSSGVVLWSFSAPLGALLFSNRRGAALWFGAFLGVIVLSAALDPLLSNTADIPQGLVTAFYALNILGVTGTSYFLLHYFVRERERAASIIATERERSERLLLNVLPEPIAERLKSGESPIADRISEAGVLFADIAGFTPLSETLPPEELIGFLDDVFTLFDGLVVIHGLEKIKTIGDEYMVACGLPGEHRSQAEDLAHMALEMREAIASRPTVRLRIGIDVGPVVAGVVGRRKFSYDLWGDTVNTASRMESHGLAGSIQVTERAYRRLESAFDFESRGVIDVKGKGLMRTYLLVRAKDRGHAVRGDGRTEFERSLTE